MNRLLPSLWLLGAVLYAAATLLLTQPFLDRGSASLAATHETIVAKQPEPASPKLPLVVSRRARAYADFERDLAA